MLFDSFLVHPHTALLSYRRAAVLGYFVARAREKEKDKERKRRRKTKTEKDRDKERQRQRERDAERERERERWRKRERANITTALCYYSTVGLPYCSRSAAC
jgi:type VI protein secretion system component VasK